VQFSRNLTYRKNTFAFRGVAVVLKGGLIAASFYYVISKMLLEQVALKEIASLFTNLNFVLLLVLLIVLMVFNWAIEAKKWQIIAEGHQYISFRKAFKAILAGVSMDAVLPMGAGAISSKLLSVNNSGKKQLVAPVIIAQGIQSIWTVAFGLIGLSQLANFTTIFPIYGTPSIYVLIGIAFIFIVWGWRRKWSNSFKFYIESIKNVPVSIWLLIASLSLLRYLIFFAQLLILSTYLAPEIPLSVLIGCISWMFFAKTIIPKPGHLGALGIRGASVVFFLNLVGYASSEVVLATVVLWFINLALPSLVGLYFIKDLQFKNNIAND